ncbi:BPI fold-containing family A member 2 [Myotis myotis]|uniref:Lipid-binding serum glycoprotein N-terminal domain-containing protein n=1 Tax=Myotis myotis TaxID=51298 RepID=A0A7J7VX04_MYOMY|nr:BPI fold-containing family A member 2 [Myotis myotis]KAF6329619.1 hypothetical protein mMyoMyo1_001538 [Myotis myotis]
MFQLWKLVLLCGLVSGTSAGIIHALGEDLGGILNSLKPAVNKGTDNIESVLQKLRGDIIKIQETNAWQTIADKFHQTKDLLNRALSKLFKGGQSLGLKISNVCILNFKAEPTTDGPGFLLRFPTSADVSLTLPLVRKTVNLKVSLDLLATVQIETDPKSGGSRVVMTECASDPDSISFTLLGEHSAVVNKLTGTVSSFLSDTVSFLVQSHMCPLLRTVVSTLGPQFAENIIKNGQQVADVPVNA